MKTKKACAGRLLRLALAAAVTTAAWAPASAQLIDPAPAALQQFVADAMARHPRIAALSAELKAARAGARGASRPLYNPTLTAEYEDTDIAAKTVGLSQAIDWSDKRESRAAVGAARLRAAGAELFAAREAFAADLLEATSRHQSLKARVELAQRRLTLMTDFRDLARRRLDAGDIAPIELDLAVMALSQAELELARARSELAAVVQELAFLVADSAPAPSLPADPPAVPELDVESRLETLPAIQQARASLGVAEAELDLSRKETRPDPTFGVRAGREGDERLISLELEIPLFIRNDYSDAVVAADAEVARASSELVATGVRLRTQLSALQQRLEQTRDAWNTWQRHGQSSLERQVKTIEKLWRAGEIGTTDYLVQINQTLDTRTSAVELSAELWQAWFDWLEAAALVQAWLDIEQEME